MTIFIHAIGFSAALEYIFIPSIFSAVVSCLFVSGRTVVYRSHYKRPKFPPNIDFGGPNYRLQHLMLRLILTGPAGLC